MKAADYILSYDIADTKRLQKLARQLEKVGMRIQYSVFFLPGFVEDDLFKVIETVNRIIDPDEDDVRIYTLMGTGTVLGKGVDLKNFAVFS